MWFASGIYSVSILQRGSYCVAGLLNMLVCGVWPMEKWRCKVLSTKVNIESHGIAIWNRLIFASRCSQTRLYLWCAWLLFGICSRCYIFVTYIERCWWFVAMIYTVEPVKMVQRISEGHSSMSQLNQYVARYAYGRWRMSIVCIWRG